MDLTLDVGENIYNLRIVALVMYRGAFLFDFCKTDQYYFPVGGRVKFGETVEEALVREMQEELGITVSDYRMIGIAEQFLHITKPWHEHSIIFSIDLDDELELNLETGIVPIASHDFKNYPIVPAWIETAIANRDTFKMYYVDEIDVRTNGEDISVQISPERSFNARVSAKVSESNKVLFDFLALDWGHPVPVGGRMQWGETLLEAIHREIREELSTEIMEVRFLGITTDVFYLSKPGNSPMETHFVSFNFEVSVDTSKIQFADGCAGVWLTPDEIRDLPMKLESFKQFID
ncbi:NUDIX domain-containing protein [Erysipelothrix sp. HDW6C]|uniref:NUDIX domain-containing protein n=1 Tax=Erysipelothrix sp. HDW6C TaxID=2714930 RepID=UPI0014087CBD|nr:NUDIX domain-containing protein [Erysipelothrix sp. HDW6C]QIK68908.1 NUDIX domain-containing protein [Erysipelothrix sp. HDW6C]